MQKLLTRILRKRGRVATRVAFHFREIVASEAVFVITPGRSGTKALNDFLTRYSDMYCVHAPKPWLATVGYCFHQGSVTNDFATGAFYSARESYLKAAFEQRRTFFDGDCKNLPLVPLIAELMPNSKFLHVVRSPSEFIESGYRRGYFGSLPPELWGHLERAPSFVGDRSEEQRIEKLAFFWEEANRIAEVSKSTLGEGRVGTLVAEEFFARPERIIDCVRRIVPSVNFSPKGRYRIRRLNRQPREEPLPFGIRALIDDAVERICVSRHIYYGARQERV